MKTNRYTPRFTARDFANFRHAARVVCYHDTNPRTHSVPDSCRPVVLRADRLEPMNLNQTER